MKKRKKKKKILDKEADNENEFAERIKKVTEGLNYISETDAGIYLFVGSKVAELTKEEILKANENPPETAVEERDFAEFFNYLTQMQDWFGEDEKASTRKYIELKELLESNLKDLKVYKIGRIELDVYVVGLDLESKMIGIKTKAVET